MYHIEENSNSEQTVHSPLKCTGIVQGCWLVPVTGIFWHCMCTHAAWYSMCMDVIFYSPTLQGHSAALPAPPPPPPPPVPGGGGRGGIPAPPPPPPVAVPAPQMSMNDMIAQHKLKTVQQGTCAITHTCFNYGTELT